MSLPGGWVSEIASPESSEVMRIEKLTLAVYEAPMYMFVDKSLSSVFWWGLPTCPNLLHDAVRKNGKMAEHSSCWEFSQKCCVASGWHIKSAMVFSWILLYPAQTARHTTEFWILLHPGK